MLLTWFMAATKKTREKPDSPPSTIRTLSLTEKGALALEALSRQATDEIGRTISGSAIVRALLRFAEAQGPTWVRGQLIPLVEAELSAGVLWGTDRSGQSSPGSRVKRTGNANALTV